MLDQDTIEAFVTNNFIFDSKKKVLQSLVFQQYNEYTKEKIGKITFNKQLKTLYSSLTIKLIDGQQYWMGLDNKNKEKKVKPLEEIIERKLQRDRGYYYKKKYGLCGPDAKTKYLELKTELARELQLTQEQLRHIEKRSGLKFLFTSDTDKRIDIIKSAIESKQVYFEKLEELTTKRNDFIIPQPLIGRYNFNKKEYSERFEKLRGALELTNAVEIIRKGTSDSDILASKISEMFSKLPWEFPDEKRKQLIITGEISNFCSKFIDPDLDINNAIYDCLYSITKRGSYKPSEPTLKFNQVVQEIKDHRKEGRFTFPNIQLLINARFYRKYSHEYKRRLKYYMKIKERPLRNVFNDPIPTPNLRIIEPPPLRIIEPPILRII